MNSSSAIDNKGRLRRAAPLRLIAGLGELGGNGGRQPANHRDPGALGRLPGALVLASGVSPVGELIAVGRCAADSHGQRGIAGGLEAHGDLPKVEIDVRVRKG